MHNPLLLDIILYLTKHNLVQGDGIDAFRDFMPECPDSLVCLHEYRGDPAVHYEPSVHRSVQISVRDKDADIARQKALEIYKSLKSDNLVVHFTDTRWGQVHLRQTPFKIGEDENNRAIYGFNIGITTTID